MKFSNNYFLLVMITVLFAGCEKVIQVDLNKAAPQIVIQGNVTDGTGPYKVTINKSVPFDSENKYPPVTGATVMITDVSLGIPESLSEVSPGVYLTNYLRGFEGNTYELSVQAEGKEYKASSTMPHKVSLDSVSFFTNTFFGTSITNPLPNFQDPAGVNNYYYFRQSINNKPTNSFFVFDDRLSDGRYISRQLFNDSGYIKKLDTIQLEMQCIDKNVYNYFNQIIEAQGNGNSGPVAAPGNPFSNISNGAFGYFSAHTSETKEGVFK